MKASTKSLHGSCLIALLNLPAAIAAPAAAWDTNEALLTADEVQAHKDWRETMAHQPTPAKGCFHANYPSTAWQAQACTTMPPLVHPTHRNARNARMDAIRSVGNSNDYTLSSDTLISQTVGSFPRVSGVTSESSGGPDGLDQYSLQINSNYDATTDACADRSGCTVWQQFIYADNGSQAQGGVFMQYWLRNYGSDCPTDWISDGDTSCYRSSDGISAPDVPATQLANVKLTASATPDGVDTVTLTYGGTAYSVSASDDVLEIGTVWTDSEFNVFGNGAGLQANFNRGSSITVKVAAVNGDTAAPTCTSGKGTTGETNNLYLGHCYTSGGKRPSITFTEAN